MNRAERRAEAARDRLRVRALRRLDAVTLPPAQAPFSPPVKRDIPREALEAYRRGAITYEQAKLLSAFASRKPSALLMTAHAATVAHPPSDTAEAHLGSADALEGA